MEDLKDKKMGRDELEEAELGMYSPEVKRLRENLLDSFDDETEFCCTVTQDLDSFMKSFEEEIIASPSSGEEAVQLVDLTSDSGESQLDLGYLLEASDDELGLLPTMSSFSSSGGLEGESMTELVRVESHSFELGSELWEAPSYDLFEFGLGESESNYSCGNGSGGLVGKLN